MLYSRALWFNHSIYDNFFPRLPIHPSSAGLWSTWICTVNLQRKDDRERAPKPLGYINSFRVVLYVLSESLKTCPVAKHTGSWPSWLHVSTEWDIWGPHLPFSSFLYLKSNFWFCTLAIWYETKHPNPQKLKSRDVKMVANYFSPLSEHL